MARGTTARLNLKALRDNVALARSRAPAAKLMAVVKANAYGHGAARVAGTLAPLADALAVACIEEALALRASGISLPILLLEGPFEPRELAEAARENFWLMIDNEQQVSWLEEAKLDSSVRCWLKIDTGMHRLGVAPERAAAFQARLVSCHSVEGTPVLATHFACADDLDSDMTERQLSLFEKACAGLPGERSAANSPGLLAWPASHLNWIRPGYMLYGNSPFERPHDLADQLRPVMTLVSSIISLRDVPTGETVGYAATWVAQRPSRIATISIGYGDGYPRRATNGTPVLIRGQRAPLAGRVSMDMITVDVTDIPGVTLGDDVVIWGDGLALGEVARHADTIGYELTTRMPMRTPRVIVEE